MVVKMTYYCPSFTILFMDLQAYARTDLFILSHVDLEYTKKNTFKI